jgi:hypothetical protein
MFVESARVGIGANRRSGSMVSKSLRKIGNTAMRWWMGEWWKRGTRRQRVKVAWMGLDAGREASRAVALWEPKLSRSEVEQFLSLLADVPQLAFLVSLTDL